MLRQRWYVGAAYSITLALGCLLIGGQSTPAQAPTSEAILRLGGNIARPLHWTTEEFAALPHHEVRARDRDGTEATFAGVALVDLLRLAGVPLGAELRGPHMATYLLVEAADGYRVVFALPELDPAFTDRMVLLVDRRDGQPLAATEGPLRLVVPGEKRHARWVRQVVAFTIHQAP